MRTNNLALVPTGMPGPCLPFPEDEGRLLGLVMAYQHPEIVHRLATENGWSQDEAQEVFNDTLGFLYLCGMKSGLAPTPRIDIGWHAFLLYTKDYAAFCDKFFGRFMHHLPVMKLGVHIKMAQATCSDPDSSAEATNGQHCSIAETATFAMSVFGTLSKNWVGKASCSDEKCGSDSEDGCQAGDKRAQAACSKSDCTPVACEHR